MPNKQHRQDINMGDKRTRKTLEQMHSSEQDPDTNTVCCPCTSVKMLLTLVDIGQNLLWGNHTCC